MHAPCIIGLKFRSVLRYVLCLQPVTTDQAPKKFVVDLAPGSSVSLANQNGYPKIAAQAPGTGVIVAQVRRPTMASMLSLVTSSTLTQHAFLCSVSLTSYKDTHARSFIG